MAINIQEASLKYWNRTFKQTSVVLCIVSVNESEQNDSKKSFQAMLLLTVDSQILSGNVSTATQISTRLIRVYANDEP